jgi:hypothetical protein
MPSIIGTKMNDLAVEMGCTAAKLSSTETVLPKKPAKEPVACRRDILSHIWPS